MELPTKPRLKLCCITSPILNDKGQVTTWCSYCGKQLCHACWDDFMAEDDYNHHEECLKLCPHTDAYHFEEDAQPFYRREYT